MAFANGDNCGDANRVWLEPWDRVVDYEIRNRAPCQAVPQGDKHAVVRKERYKCAYEWRGVSQDCVEWQMEHMRTGEVKFPSRSQEPGDRWMNMHDGSSGLIAVVEDHVDYAPHKFFRILLGEVEPFRINGPVWGLRVNIDYTLKYWWHGGLSGDARPGDELGWLSYLKRGWVDWHKDRNFDRLVWGGDMRPE